MKKLIFILLMISSVFSLDLSYADNVELKFSSLIKGSSSRIQSEYEFVAKSEKELIKSIESQGDSVLAKSRLLQSIDFSRYQVVGIFCGQKSSAAYGIGVNAVREFNDRIVVYYSVREPSKDSTATFAAQLVEPFEIISIPKSKKRIVFHKTISYL